MDIIQRFLDEKIGIIVDKHNVKDALAAMQSLGLKWASGHEPPDFNPIQRCHANYAVIRCFYINLKNRQKIRRLGVFTYAFRPKPDGSLVLAEEFIDAIRFDVVDDVPDIAQDALFSILVGNPGQEE